MKGFFSSASKCACGLTLSLLYILSIGDLVEAFHSTIPQYASTVRTSSIFPQQTKHLPEAPQSPLWDDIKCSTALRSNPSNDNFKDNDDEPNLWEKVVASVSKSAAWYLAKKYNRDSAPIYQSRAAMSIVTFARVIVPSILAGFIAYLIFPALAMFLCTTFNDAGVFSVLSQDSSQFVQNFLTVAGLLFSILVGQTYYFLYQQQEMVYYALFNEVTEAKSLLEQVALVSQGRSMYQRVLQAMSTYVQTDLKKLQADPAVLLSARPMDDPLETIMYLTSVGVPSTVYETVKSLRQARAQRLGALQRKLPTVHMVLLWILALVELVSFPLLGAGTQVIGGYKILTVEGCLFGVMTMGIFLTLRVVGELWRPAGGAYNVDNVLKVMVRGLEQELDARMAGKTIEAQRRNFPSPNIV
ncbi:DUF4239 domain containing protein [Nitzschia inconspicua]|uniref:DUF4239 domain containing protein n=1 Tax=Nitzschia inconspicua TaxID=303405 RepID=A0A9K3PXP9_9STRA|nr:DUF4239 domain containing protein [Nitzschia inconspicua]